MDFWQHLLNNVSVKYLKQTRLHKGKKPKERGNCFPTVIACVLDLDSPEEVVQFQEHYHHRNPDHPKEWSRLLYNYLRDKGYELWESNEHFHDDRFYFVTGTSPRNSKVTHICIYQNGRLIHDPHPDDQGILDELLIQYLEPISNAL